MSLFRFDTKIKGSTPNGTVLTKITWMRHHQQADTIHRTLSQENSWFPSNEALWARLNHLATRPAVREALENSAGGAMYLKKTAYSALDRFGNNWSTPMAQIDVYAHMDKHYATFWKLKYPEWLIPKDVANFEMKVLMAGRRTGKSYFLQQYQQEYIKSLKQGVSNVGLKI